MTAPGKLAVTSLGLWPGLVHFLDFLYLAVLQFLILLSNSVFIVCISHVVFDYLHLLRISPVYQWTELCVSGV